MLKRTVTAFLEKSKKSVLLIGPRQTGKSTLIHGLQPDLEINFAHEPTYLQFARNSSELEERLAAGSYKTVFIDEVQRLPSLLNTIQSILDDKKKSFRFFLTGSSMRKLVRGKANLLPGRIHTYHLSPLTYLEIGESIRLQDALATGTLPGVWVEKDKQEKIKTLKSYASTYLKEEIQAEALSRSIEGFSRFIFVAAAWAGKFLDFSKLASEAQVSRQSAIRYFEILEDTLIVRRCSAFSKSSWRRLVQAPRYFFFDTGVLNGLLENFGVSQDRIGPLFEHFIFNQIQDIAGSLDKSLKISSYRTEHGAEVDFIVEYEGELTALEAKASKNVGPSDLRGFKSFAEYYPKKHRAMIVYLGESAKVIGGVRIVPWQRLFHELTDK